MSMSKDIKERIEHALSEIQPYLEADKGGIEVVDYSNHGVCCKTQSSKNHLPP